MSNYPVGRLAWTRIDLVRKDRNGDYITHSLRDRDEYVIVISQQGLWYQVLTSLGVGWTQAQIFWDE